MNALRSDYISCLKIHGVPLLPPVLTQDSRKEMEYYKMLAISTEQRIADLKGFTTLNANSASMSYSNTEGGPEQHHIVTPSLHDTLINIHNVKKQTKQSETQELPNKIFESTIESQASICDNVENNAEFPSMLSDVTVIDVSTAKLEKLPNDIYVTEKDTILEYDMSILQKGVDTTDGYLRQTTTGDLEIMNVNKDLRNMSVGDCIDGKETTGEKTKVSSEIYSNSSVAHSPDSISIISNPAMRLGSSKKISGSLNDISSTYLDSPKLVRQRSYTIEHPSPVLLAHLEVQSLYSGMDVSSISMSESCATLPRQEIKRPSWDLEMAKVKWTSMTSELNKPQYNTEEITADKKCVNRMNSYHKQIKYSSKQGFSRTQSPTKVRLLSDKQMCKELTTSLPKDTKSNCRSLAQSFTTSVNQIPLRRTLSTQKNSLPTQNVVQKVTEITSDASQSATTVNARSIQEMVEKIRTQQVTQMAELLEKQKVEQMILQKSFQEQKNIFMKHLKQMCPMNLSQSKEANKENLDVIKNCESETDTFMVRCEEVLKKGRVVFHDVKMAKTIDSLKTPEFFNNSAPVNLKTIFSQPNSIEGDSNSSGNVKLDWVDNGFMTDRTNDTLADLNFTLSSDLAEDSFRFETNHNNFSNQMLHVNKTFTSDHGSKTSEQKLDKTFLKSQLKADCDLNENSVNTELDNVKKSVRKLFQEHPTSQQSEAANRIVAWCRGYLVRRLMRTARVQATVQTLRDALGCALQLHRDREGIRGADIDLHRRLIQQITAACYSLHDTFVSSSVAERCEIIAQDRQRLRHMSAREQMPSLPYDSPLSRTKKLNKTKIDRMSQSHLGVFPSQTGWMGVHNSDPMTRSNYVYIICTAAVCALLVLTRCLSSFIGPSSSITSKKNNYTYRKTPRLVSSQSDPEMNSIFSDLSG